MESEIRSDRSSWTRHRAESAATGSETRTFKVGSASGGTVHSIGAPNDVVTVIDLQRDVVAPASEPRIGSTLRTRISNRAMALVLAGGDVLCLAAAFLLAQLLTVGFAARVEMTLLAVVLSSVLWVLIFHSFGLYVPQHLSSPEVFRSVIGATSVGVVLTVVITLGSFPDLSRKWIGLTWVLALVLELGSRRVWNWWLHQLRSDRRLMLRTLIVGTNREAGRLAEILNTDASLGYFPVGYVSTRIEEQHSGAVVADFGELIEVIEHLSIDCLFVASTDVSLEQVSMLHRIARRTGAELRVTANLPQTLSSRLRVKSVGDIMAISLRPPYLTGAESILKRTFDLVVSMLGLILSLPLMGVIAVGVKLTSEGPVLFRQERVTRAGRVFTMYKFRTMVHEADRVMQSEEIDRTEAFFKLRGKPLVTPIGRILRRLSLDEIPQLWNIVRGDMSLVGPRPLPAEQVAANLQLLEPRHEVRAGLTGWWQINGRSDIAPEEAVQMDLFYIENWSLTFDLYILLKTLGAVLVRRGAY